VTDINGILDEFKAKRRNYEVAKNPRNFEREKYETVSRSLVNQLVTYSVKPLPILGSEDATRPRTLAYGWCIGFGIVRRLDGEYLDIQKVVEGEAPLALSTELHLFECVDASRDDVILAGTNSEHRYNSLNWDSRFATSEFYTKQYDLLVPARATCNISLLIEHAERG
jgi:hypothetical protein